MLTVLLLVILSVGPGFFLWGTIGAIRAVTDPIRRRPHALAEHRVRHSPRVLRRRFRVRPAKRRFYPGHVRPIPRPLDIAVVIPAHNEEPVIARTVKAAAELVPIENVHVLCDGCRDATAEIAETLGAKVVELEPNRGKAKAIVDGLAHFDIPRNFSHVAFVDADTELQPNYLKAALPLFSDPDVVAVAGYAKSDWDVSHARRGAGFLLAHRSRLYTLTQLLQKYGQTWRWTNVTPIVPGFASIYRSNVLHRIDIDAPGLVIEDFNMTFEIHAKKLGLIGFIPGASALTQDPDTRRDYVKQVQRWSLGFWQTVRRHGFWWSGFSLALGLTVFELVLSSVLMLVVPVLAAAVIAGNLMGHPLPIWESTSLPTVLSRDMSPWLFALAYFVPDYLLSVAVAVIDRRPQHLWYGIGSIPMRMVDAFIAMQQLVKAFRHTSTGTWESPTRR